MTGVCSVRTVQAVRLSSRRGLCGSASDVGGSALLHQGLDPLFGWTDEYDAILVDTRPDLGHLVQMSFSAADNVLMPTDPKHDSIEGAIRVRDFVARHPVD
jgi:chromosome partitioning protein